MLKCRAITSTAHASGFEMLLISNNNNTSHSLTEPIGIFYYVKCQNKLQGERGQFIVVLVKSQVNLLV